MAKKITNPESEAVEKSETPETQPENTEQPTPAPESPKEEPEVPVEPEPKAAKTTGAERPSEEVPTYADRILKNNPAYAQLYIDAQGGTFTVNTPPALRRTATLYTNPYHKRS